MQLLKNARESLKEHGIIILSVMNMELTKYQVPESRQVRLHENPEILLKLPPSTIMQQSGDIFNPDYLAIDSESNLVYRKEQFSNDDGLSAEYVIRDKRYFMSEITELVESCGFEIVERRYVRAGHFEQQLKGTDDHAKEICIVGRKI